MPPVNTPDNEFHDGDESTGVEGTILYARYMNDNQGAIQDIQQEMKNVLADAGFIPDPEKQNQLLLAIKKILSSDTEGMVKTVNTRSPDDHGNVKLGSAADADIVTSMTDTTEGRVPVVGWMGLGGDALQTTDAEFQSPSGLPTCLFKQDGSDGSNRFGYYGSGVHIEFGTDGVGRRHSANLFVRADSNVIAEWLQLDANGSVVQQRKQMLFGKFNPPTATDVGAVAVSGAIAKAGTAISDANDLPANAVSFCYSDAKNSPGYEATILDVGGLGGDGYRVQYAACYADGGKRLKYRTFNGDNSTWSAWVQIFNELNPPTAAQVGAMPYFGTALNVDLNTLGPYSAAGVYYQPANAGATAANHYPVSEAGTLLVTPSAYGCQQEYTAFSSRRKFIRGLSASWNGTNGPWQDWNEPYSPTNPNEIVSTSANSYRIAYNGYGTFWRNDGANLYLMLTNSGDPRGNYNTFRPFTVNLATGHITMGQLGLTDYTNFDARYLGKNSTLTRLGAQVTVSVPNHATVSAPAGCVQSAVQCGSDGALTGMGYRPLQILVNGTWVNVQSL
ncbi:pyocin knob domain-containing protein [Enterobacter ludwigii]|uniref:pyocin knob domain-containing protein n=1 Tax=Enterobacter ludwigii TaxID=299767 RepID=UPI0019538F5B|nr:pyocin knob domain-containing protein [Enterobacter ludwigii]